MAENTVPTCDIVACWLYDDPNERDDVPHVPSRMDLAKVYKVKDFYSWLQARVSLSYKV